MTEFFNNNNLADFSNVLWVKKKSRFCPAIGGVSNLQHLLLRSKHEDEHVFKAEQRKRPAHTAHIMCKDHGCILFAITGIPGLMTIFNIYKMYVP